MENELDTVFSAWRCERLPVSNLTLRGHSRAGESTTFFIKELNILLDVGTIENGSFPYKPSHVFLSQTRLDHSKEVFIFLNHQYELKFVMPRESAPFLPQYLNVAYKLTRNHYSQSDSKYSIIDVVQNDKHKLNSEYYFTVFETFHSVPSVGYGFWQIKSKLKEEYKELKGPQISELRKHGELVLEYFHFPLFAYTGDTSIKLFETNTDIFNFPVIITECTYLYDDELAEKNGHICWTQLRPFVERNPKITFVLTHFLMNYEDKEINEFFSKIQLPNIIVWTDLHPIKSST